MEKKTSHSKDYVRGFATKALHEGVEIDESTGAIVPPIHVSSTYEVPLEGPTVNFSVIFRNMYMEGSTIQLELPLKEHLLLLKKANIALPHHLEWQLLA
jgi:hypothetical protein